MKKFVYLYFGGAVPKDDSEKKMVNEAWETYFKKLGSALADMGNPFMGEKKMLGADKTLSGCNGYSIVHAENLEAAVHLAKENPLTKHGGTIEVHEATSVTM